MVNLAKVVSILVLLIGLPATGRAADVATPNFWDQRQRLARPDIAARPRIRFLTSVDYPPFNFLDGSGRLTGFNVDLVRMLCAELEALDRCQIEAKPFDQLVPTLLRGEADAVAAGVAVTPENRRDLAFTESYLRYPARFVVRRDAPLPELVGERVAGLRVGTVRGSAHTAMLAAFFPKAERVEFDNRDAALDALKRKQVAAVFGDGVSLSFWLDSNAAGDCCAFAGGPYLSERFLGEGLAIAVARKDADLAQALDYALGQVVAKKGFSELMLRYFPTSAF
jgi:polar amino acid transport system substrate-binding protein